MDRAIMDDESSSTSSCENRPANIHVFASSSTLHGFSHIFARHHSSLRKFSWTVAFLTSLTLLLFQSSNRVNYYMKYPHVTRLDEVTAINLSFPAVTICNLNEFRFSMITKNDMFHAGRLLGFLNDKDQLKRPSFDSVLNDLEDGPTRKRLIEHQDRLLRLSDFRADDFAANPDFNMHEFYNRTGHDLSEYLLQCTYRGQTCVPANFSEGADRYMYFRSHPHVTKLDEQEAEIMDFPAVTICNMNSFRLSQVTTDDYYFVGQSIFELFDKEWNLRAAFRDNRTWPDVEARISPIVQQKADFRPSKRYFNMFEFYNRTGHDKTGVVLDCKYRGTDCRRMKDWDVIFTRYGKCYTFNSGKLYEPLTTLKGGVDNGLELLLDTQQNEYMPVWDETDEITVEAGFKVQIHVQNEPPFIHELGFGVSPGFQTLVATQEQRIKFLPSPYGECVEEFDKKQHYHFDDYSISACRITCETKFVIENCSCRMIHMPGNGTYCDPEKYRVCADQALDYLMKMDEEQCVCKTPCDVTRYNLEMSTLRLPSTQATSYLAWKYNVSEQYVRDNFVKLNIFFEALNYETIEQKRAYEIPGLLGDIGGQMGLFIGASLLTILELFDYIYEFIKDKTWGRNLRKERREAERQASLAATTSLLVEKSEKGGSNVVSPSAQYHAVPGTIAMTFPNRPNHLSNFNGIHTSAPRHGVPIIATQPQNYPGNPRAHPYNTMPYKSNYIHAPAVRPGARYEETLPPPPPQYLGQSMMTLRGDCGVPEMPLTKRYSARGIGDPRVRETSLSYNDLLNLGENDTNPTEDDEEPEYHHRHNHTGNHGGYPGGLATLPHFSAPSHMFDPSSSSAEDQPPSFRMSVSDRQNPRIHNYAVHSNTYAPGGNGICISPTKNDYTKSLETDIH